MIAISTKELRLKMPFVRSELKKGTTFLLIHKSQLIGEIKPIKKDQKLTEIDEEQKMWEQAAIEDLGNEDWLTQEEINYYLSLPDYDESI
ncbi:MAG: hypothetical protein ACD_28C00109G0001 [uncultured bacterium]|nr:MAG: hypothetical protein ACD_28C00109G0001 [uncultured bacterium]KKT76286.1 MAG: hypothetical protein UW70_C0019G0004 [Candidatus Peregrinibacteria bacterium GW2011_GWA2_44_7]